MKNDTLKKIAGKAPRKSGIYVYKGHAGKKLYVGKASNLKARLSSYLKTIDPRIKKMISLAKNLITLKTDSEIEALILESLTIKKHKPMFNIMLRDDKQFFYIGVTEEKFPRVFVTHRPDAERPAAEVDSALSRRDRSRMGQNSTTGNFGTGKAETGNKKTGLMPKLKTDIDPTVEVRQPKDRQKSQEVWLNAMSNIGTGTVGPFTDGTALKTTLRYLRKVFPYCTCKQLHNNYCLNYHIGKCLGICCLKQQSQIYNLQSASWRTIFNEYNKNIKAIKKILSGKTNDLVKNLEKEMKKLAKKGKLEAAIKLRGKLEKLEKVFENAKIIFNIRVRPSTNNFLWKTICREAVSSLKLPCPPSRIEGYDVANIQGKYAVGAMVVFTNGEPSKNEYRKFKIRTKESPDDAGMLKEILARRFKHSEWPAPDLILIDGGKGQLNTAMAVLRDLRFTIYDLRVVALTKNKQHKGEKIYVDGKKNPIPLSNLPENVKNLLLQIDAEAHRFATSYYRKIHRRSFELSNK